MIQSSFESFTLYPILTLSPKLTLIFSEPSLRQMGGGVIEIHLPAVSRSCRSPRPQHCVATVFLCHFQLYFSDSVKYLCAVSRSCRSPRPQHCVRIGWSSNYRSGRLVMKLFHVVPQQHKSRWVLTTVRSGLYSSQSTFLVLVDFERWP